MDVDVNYLVIVFNIDQKYIKDPLVLKNDIDKNFQDLKIK